MRRRQLQLQADGLTGHLDEFWPDVADSQWFGGKAEGWERAPYWLDGAIPLAKLVNDRALSDRIAKHVDHIVTHQRADGWYAPYPLDANEKRYDPWAILLANKVLTLHHEATGDDRALRAAMRSMKAMHDTLATRPLFDWGRFRWYEGVVPAFYAYEKTGEPWLLDYARTLRRERFSFTVNRSFAAVIRGCALTTFHRRGTPIQRSRPPFHGRLGRGLIRTCTLPA